MLSNQRRERRRKKRSLHFYGTEKGQQKSVKNNILECLILLQENTFETHTSFFNKDKILGFRFRDEGQRLTISNVTKEDDGKIYKCSLALGKETNPSIFLRLVVHPPDWKEMKTTPNLILPRLTDDVQNLPSTGTSEDMSGTANGIENLAFYKLISLGFLTYHLHLLLPR